MALDKVAYLPFAYSVDLVSTRRIVRRIITVRERVAAFKRDVVSRVRTDATFCTVAVERVH